jgi:hypothetical protein
MMDDNISSDDEFDSETEPIVAKKVVRKSAKSTPRKPDGRSISSKINAEKGRVKRALIAQQKKIAPPPEDSSDEEDARIIIKAAKKKVKARLVEPTSIPKPDPIVSKSEPTVPKPEPQMDMQSILSQLNQIYEREKQRELKKQAKKQSKAPKQEPIVEAPKPKQVDPSQVARKQKILCNF